MTGGAVFGDEDIIFRRYPFRPASVFPNHRLPYAEIRTVDPAAFPPELVLNSGETLFIDARQRHEVERAVEAGLVVAQARVDVWAGVLEPFLDTEHSPEETAVTLKWLAECGLEAERVEALRSQVSGRMLAYNAFLWEWVHLGLYDLLKAYTFGAWWPGRRRAFRELYKLGMDVADLGQRNPGVRA